MDSAFIYDTFETLATESAMDKKQRENIVEFWNIHIPFVISLHNGYEYYAVSIKDGSVVHGCEPNFEDVSKEANSLSDFVDKLILGEIIL